MNLDEILISKAMEQMETIGGVIRLKYGPNQTLFHPGHESGGTYWMRGGQVKLEAVDAGGKIHFLQVVSGARVIGLPACLLRRPHSYQARALSPVEALWLDSQMTRKWMEEVPALSESLMRQLCSELEVLEGRLRSAYSLDATSRVHETLVYLKKCDPGRIWSRGEIAEWAGTTPETVARAIRDLREDGKIMTEGRKIMLLRSRMLN